MVCDGDGVFLTYALRDELRGLRLTPDWQQSQAQVKGHELLHAGKVLLTQPAVLHQHQLLKTTAALEHSTHTSQCVMEQPENKQTVPKTHVSEANQLPLVAVSRYDVTLRQVEDAGFVGQVEICQPQLILKQDFHPCSYSRTTETVSGCSHLQKSDR